MRSCLHCDVELKVYHKKVYCSNKCQQAYEYKTFISKWKRNLLDPKVLCRPNGSLSGYLRTYLFERSNEKCERCGWGEKNPVTGKAFLEGEHIDGDCTNNVESNLILLCPNCHSLTPTYKGLNKGKGRKARLGIDNRLPNNFHAGVTERLKVPVL